MIVAGDVVVAGARRLTEPEKAMLARLSSPQASQHSPGTSPVQAIDHAAVRELTEETGYTAGHWQRLGAFYPSPGVLDETTHLFVATNLTAGAMQLEPGQRVQVLHYQHRIEFIPIRPLRSMRGFLKGIDTIVEK